MSTPDDFAGAVAKLLDALGEPWTGGSHQLRFDIADGYRHTAVDIFDVDARAVVSVHTLAPHLADGVNLNHLEWVAGLLRGCQLKQWDKLPESLARRHSPAPLVDLSSD